MGPNTQGTTKEKKNKGEKADRITMRVTNPVQKVKVALS